jgi:hypothetical protein
VRSARSAIFGSELPPVNAYGARRRDPNVKDKRSRARALSHFLQLGTNRSDARPCCPSFAASALQAGDEVTLMLFHDAVYMALEGGGEARAGRAA